MFLFLHRTHCIDIVALRESTTGDYFQNTVLKLKLMERPYFYHTYTNDFPLPFKSSKLLQQTVPHTRQAVGQMVEKAMYNTYLELNINTLSVVYPPINY